MDTADFQREVRLGDWVVVQDTYQVAGPIIAMTREWCHVTVMRVGDKLTTARKYLHTPHVGQELLVRWGQVSLPVKAPQIAESEQRSRNVWIDEQGRVRIEAAGFLPRE